MNSAKVLQWLGSVVSILVVAMIIRTWNIPTDIAFMSSTMGEIQKKLSSLESRLLFIERLDRNNN